MAAGAAVLAFGATLGSGLRLVAFVLLTALAGVVLAKLLGQYDRDHRVMWHTTGDELPGTITWAAVVTVVVVIALRTGAESLPSASALIGLALTLLALGAGLRAAARQLWRQATPPERVVIVGSGPLADAAQRKFRIFEDLHFELVAVVAERDAFGDSAGATRFGRLLERIGDIDRILMAAPTTDEHLIRALVPFCRHHQIKLGLIPPARGMFGTAVLLDHLAELPIVQYNSWDVSRTTMAGKRAFDVLASGIGVLACLPFLPFVVLAIKLDSPGPAFFRQVRGGQGGRPFRMLKFRTMVVDAEARLKELVDVDALDSLVFKFEDDPRITRVGRLLRRTSLDEVPQLWNVLRGDMSIVGPRPEQLDLVERYPPEVAEVRLAVKPGLTGPMQVSGRGQLTMEERLAVEREYVENLSLARDLRILARTASAVVRARGAY